MNPNDIPVKTPKGLTEVKTRALGLKPRMRTALLLVDGLRSLRELEQMIIAAGATAGSLDTLFNHGLIMLPKKQATSQDAADAGGGTSSANLRQTAWRSSNDMATQQLIQNSDVALASTLPPVFNSSRMPTTLPPVAERYQAARTSPSTADADKKQLAKVKKDVEPMRMYPILEPAEPDLDINPLATSQPTFSNPELDLKLIVARAHLANALDQHVGINGYLLKQEVVACESRAELDSFLIAIERSLIMSLDNPAVAKLMRTANSILEG